jgi:hypothetical protein
MVWFKVDDKFHRGKKVRKLGPAPITVPMRVAAVGLWTLCGDWAAENGTDGFVPNEQIETWDAVGQVRARLVEVDLWEEIIFEGEAGIRFHDWPDWQPTAEEVEKKRADVRRRVAEHRERQKIKSTPDSGNALPNALGTYGPEPEPVTTPVVPSTSDLEDRSGLSFSSPRAKKRAPAEKVNRGTRIPEDFEVTPEMVSWAAKNAPSVDGRRQTAQFVDYWTAATGRTATKRDWVAAWRTWMRNAEDDAPRRPSKRPSAADEWDMLTNDE